LIVSSSQELFHFCKALHHYTTAVYLVRAPWLKDRIDDDLFDKRDKELNETITALNLKYLSPESLHVRKYFSVHVMIAQAEAMKQTRPRSPDVIGKAFNICRKAKKEIDKVPVLEPTVYESLAEFRFLEACEWYRKSVFGKTRDLFTESGFYRKKALEVITERNMERSEKGGHNMLAYAILLRSWGVFLADIDHKLDDAIQKLKEAADVGRKVISIQETLALGTTSKRMLYRAYEDHGVCNSYLAEFYGRLGDNVSKISKKKYSQNAFRFCNRAYNLIFHNYRSCQFTANDQTLTRLITIFPKMMNFVGIMKELQDKAMMNLLIVQQQAQREGEDDIHMSGSELDSCSSSERESSDDDITQEAAAAVTEPLPLSEEATSSKRVRN